MKKIVAVLLAALLIAGVCILPAPAADQNEENLVTAAKEMRKTGKVQMNFTELEISKFIHFMSEVLGENIVVDPAVSGKVSVVSPKEIPLKEARQVMLSVLEMNNLAIQDMGGFAKVVPLSAGPSTSSEVYSGDYSVEPGEAVAVQVVPLKYVKADFVIAPLKASLPGLNASSAGSGASVVLTGKQTLLNKAAKIIRTIDNQDSVRSIKVYQLKHAGAKSLETIFNAMGKDMTSKLAGIVAVGDPRTKQLSVIGGAQAQRETARVLKQLDVPSRAQNYHVYKLQNADAKTVAEQLTKVLSGLASAKAASGDSAASASGRATVVPDLPTNTLVFTASQEEFDSLKSVLKELDVRPRQVLLRGLIAEVNLTKLKGAGIDWAAWGGKMMGDVVGAANVQIGNTSVPNEVMSLYEKMVTREEYKTDDRGNGYTTTNTDGAGLVYAYVKLLNKYDAINVLSMPQIMCTDNLESHLQVGQVIPQLKGSLTDKTNTTSVTNSYDYKDVGLILTLTPHIRSGDLVALDIQQSTEELLTTTASNTPITSKREIKTNVLAANGQTIVLGGMIKETEKVMRSRVPFFSYIPLIGHLFRSSDKEREKIDLMVFLTPEILQSPDDATRVTDNVVNRRNSLSPAEFEQLRKNSKDFEKATSKREVETPLLNPLTEEEKAAKAEKEKKKKEQSSEGTEE